MVPWVSQSAKCAMTAFAGVLSLAAPALAKDAPVAGIVFVDKNGDGKLSPDEQGLAGAVVSDGVNVYKTDAQGRFSFTAVTDAMLGESALPIVFLSVPDGHRGTTPWFVALAGERQADEVVSFGVVPQAQPRPFEFVHVTDIHAVPQGGKQWTAFADEMKAGTADYRFIMDTGDEGDLPNLKAPDGAVAEMQASRDIFQAIPLPSYHTAGNHDVMAGAALRAGWKADSRDFGYGLYCRLFGPARWSFTYGGIHFVGVDTIARDGGMGRPTGGQNWLARDLATIPADMPVYLFGHHFAGWEKVLAQRPIRYAFYGHMHDDEIAIQDGTTLVQSGSLGRCNQRNRHEGYRVARVESDGSIHSIYRFAGVPQAVIFDHPAQAEITDQPLEFSGYAYGLEGKDGSATYNISGVRGDCAVQAQPLGLILTAAIPVAPLPCGYHKLAITAAAGKATASGEALFLKRVGPNPPFTGNGAKLCIAIGGVDVPATVLVNGHEVGQVPKTRNGGDKYVTAAKWTQVVSFDVPADSLLGLNTITVKPGTKPDGVTDQIFMSFLWMERDGQVYKDMRQQAYGMYWAFSIDQYIDLGLAFPDPQDLRRRVAAQTAPQ